MEQFVTSIALIGTVIVIASLLSGLERSGVPLVAVFLALGALLGPHGLGLLDIGLNSPTLQILATLGLALVLFSDAVTIDIKEVRNRRWLAWRVLGPGTLFPAAIIALAAWYLLRIQPAAAALLGAALASTDPVMVRSVLRSKALPATPRLALRLETGMNDVVLLPIIVISMLLLRAESPSVSEVARHALGLLVLGPLLGAAVGWIGITVLARVRDRVGVRRDYESLYALGLAFTGYAAAEAVGGSGFLAAFAAGLLVAAQDIELCDCFLEYGEATAEMLLLLTFVAFGTSLIWTGLTIIDVRTLAFAAVALFARTALLLPILSGKGLGLEWRDRWLIALIGPRGLSSLLFTLLPVFAGVPGASQLFTVACLVVLLSVVVHGGGIAWFLRSTRESRAQLVSLRPAETPAALPERIDTFEVRGFIARNEPFVVVDSRNDRSFHADDLQAKGAIRILAEDAVQGATTNQIPKDATIVVYCACTDEATSLRVVKQLRQAGWPKARALLGSWAAWQQAGLPVEKK